MASDTAARAGVKIFLGCPMYDGRCHAQFAFSMCQLSALCSQLGISLQVYFPSGDALVMKARNTIADLFMRSDCTHLMLIDADIGFDARDVVALLDLQLRDDGSNEYDVLSAPYPLKVLAWDKIARAGQMGLADSDPADLRNVASDVLMCPAQTGQFDVAKPLEVTQAGTGFMLIRRRTLERFRENYPQRRYKVESAGKPPEVMTLFFDTGLDGETVPLGEDLRDFLDRNPAANHDEIRTFVSAREERLQEFVSEDFLFCRLVRGIGLKVWTCPWITLSHTGSFEFRSRLVDLARLAAS